MDWDAAMAADIDFVTAAGRKQQEQNRNTNSSYVPTVTVRTFSFSLMEQVYAHNADVSLDGASDFSQVKLDYRH